MNSRPVEKWSLSTRPTRWLAGYGSLLGNLLCLNGSLCKVCLSPIRWALDVANLTGKPENTREQSVAACKYVRPFLKEFGAVRALTQAGSAAMSEMVPVDDPVCMRNPNAMC